MQPAVAEPILNIDELSEYLRIAKSSLYKLCQEGKIPGQKVGRHWRFRKQAIDTWLANNSQPDLASVDVRVSSDLGKKWRTPDEH